MSKIDKSRMRFGEFIRYHRESQGFTQKELSEALSIDIPMLSRYERNQRPIKEKLLPLLASKLNLDPIEIRKRWIADKVVNVIMEEEDVNDILDMVEKNFNKYSKE